MNQVRSYRTTALLFGLSRNRLAANTHYRHVSLSAALLRRETPDAPKRTFSSTESLLNFNGQVFSTWPKTKLLRNTINFTACQYDFLLDHAEKIMVVFYKLPIVKGIMKWFIYNQFVGGDTVEEVRATARELKKSNIEPMLAIPMETENLTPDMDVNAWQEGNLVKMIDSLEKAQKVANNHPPVVHLKVTGVMDSELFYELGKYTGMDWADQESGNAAKFEKCVDELAKIMADPGYKSSFYDEILKYSPGGADLLKHVYIVANRFEQLAEATVRNNVECAIDAEYISINPAIAIVTMAMARRANRPDKAFIWNTYQCYLKNTSKIVDFEIDYLKRHGLAWGAKIVRGAYMEKERLKAEQAGYPDPVNDTLEDTHDNYNNIVKGLIENMETPEYKNTLKILVASHNAETVKMTYNLRKASCTPENIIFGQLYGMCDHISSELGNKNVPIYKSMPVGSFEDVMPYLARRGTENKSVMRGNHEECKLLRRAFFGMKL